jgi:hypothetical protein
MLSKEHPEHCSKTNLVQKEDMKKKKKKHEYKKSYLSGNKTFGDMNSTEFKNALGIV